MILQTTQEEMAYLAKKDKRLGAVIASVGPLSREMNPDLFSAIIRHIIGQQISVAAQRTVYRRLLALGELTPARITGMTPDELQSIGLSYRKVGYIQGFAEKVANGDFDPQALVRMSDEETVKALSALPGIGPWTAEMLMIFSLGRKNVLSYGDLAIHRGMKRLYGHKEIPRERFERYRKRYAPFGTAASLYLWHVAKD